MSEWVTAERCALRARVKNEEEDLRGRVPGARKGNSGRWWVEEGRGFVRTLDCNNFIE